MDINELKERSMSVARKSYISSDFRPMVDVTITLDIEAVQDLKALIGDDAVSSHFHNVLFKASNQNE